MRDYVIPDGAFEKAYLKLASTGWALNLQSAPRPGGTKGPSNSKVKFSCPSCGANAWGKADLQIACIPCGARMAARPAVAEPRTAAGVDFQTSQSM